jgi:hypothetical protein
VTSVAGPVGDSIPIGRHATCGALFGCVDRLRCGDMMAIATGQGTF